MGTLLVLALLGLVTVVARSAEPRLRGGVRLSAKSRAVDVTDFTITRIDEGVPSAELLASPVYRTAGPYEELPGPVEIRRMDAPGADWLVYYDENLDLWIPVETRRDGRDLVARTDHLSLWSSMKSGVDWLAIQLYRLTGTRTTPPECTGDKPSWVTNFVQEESSHVRLLTCIGGNGDEATVSVRNNRGYPLWVSFTNESGLAAPDIQTELSLGLREILELAFGAVSSDGRSYLAPGKQLDAAFAQPTGGSSTGVIQTHATLDEGIVALHVVMELVDHFTLVGMQATAVECWAKVPWSLRASGTDDAS